MTEPTGPTPPTATREDLLVKHTEARHRRNEAALGSAEWEKASEEVAQIEIEIARIEREMVPPKL
jgi:hypothetical protein